LHAARLAEVLGIRKVVIPPLAGLFSALGLLLARYRYESSRSLNLPSQETEGILGQCFAELESEARQAIERGGLSLDHVSVYHEADLRYETGGAIITIPFVESRPDSNIDAIVAEFRDRHETLYGFRANAPVDVVMVRVRLEAPTEELTVSGIGSYFHQTTSPDVQPAQDRRASFGAMHGDIMTPVLTDRGRVRDGAFGPLIIEEPDTTILVPPGWHVSLDLSQALLMTVASGSDRA
jgi:N-methylhydantoinase A